MGKIILISSQKKDIGKSTIAIKTSIELSARGNKVLLIDLSLGKKKIAEHLNVHEEIIYDLKDVLDEMCAIDQSIIEISDNFSILPFPRIENKLGKIEKHNFNYLINQVKDNYDIILIDIDGISNLYYIDYENIKNVILINNNDFSSFKQINNDALIINKMGNSKINVVINRYVKKSAKKGNMLKLNELKKMIDRDILSVIEEDINFQNLNYNFLFNREINSFNNTIELIANSIV